MATIDMDRKEGATYSLYAPFAEGAGSPSNTVTQCGLGRGLLPYAYQRLHPSSRLTTIDVGQKLGGGGCAPFWGMGSIEHKVAWAEAYLHIKWHLRPSSLLTTTDIGQKLGAVPL